MTSSSTNPFYHTLYKLYINRTNSMQKRAGVLDDEVCLLAGFAFFKVDVWYHQCKFASKVSFRQTAAFLPCSDCQISSGPTAVSQCVSTVVRQRWPGSACRVSRKPDCFWSIETFRAVASPIDYSSTRQIRM